MDILTHSITLTGARLGGVIVHPSPFALFVFSPETQLLRSLTIELTIPSPLEEIREAPPHLVTVMHVGPDPA